MKWNITDQTEQYDLLEINLWCGFFVIQLTQQCKSTINKPKIGAGVALLFNLYHIKTVDTQEKSWWRPSSFFRISKWDRPVRPESHLLILPWVCWTQVWDFYFWRKPGNKGSFRFQVGCIQVICNFIQHRRNRTQRQRITKVWHRVSGTGKQTLRPSFPDMDAYLS